MIKIRLECRDRDTVLLADTILHQEPTPENVLISPPSYSKHLNKYLLTITIDYDVLSKKDYIISVPWDDIHIATIMKRLRGNNERKNI